jgi:hypothetical protein
LPFPFVLYPLLRALRLSAADSASVAAHFGSVSVVTFAVATAALARAGVPHESHAALWVAVMEAPGLLAGRAAGALGHARDAPAASGGARRSGRRSRTTCSSARACCCCWGPGDRRGGRRGGHAPIQAVFIDPFKGVLALFLLELGLVAGARLAEVRRFARVVLVVGLAVPPLPGAGRCRPWAARSG